jgi:AcrR family transcriptional regulator
MSPADRRKQLLDAAIEVIARDGYSAISIDAIAREADVTRPVVYGVFDDLGALLGALLDRQENRALEQLLTVLEPGPDMRDPDAYLAQTVRRLVEIVAGDPQTWRPILAAWDTTPEVVRERIARDRELVRSRMQSLLEVGLAMRGGPEIDAELGSHGLLAIAEYFGRQICEDPDRFSADRLVAMVEGLLASLGSHK